MSGSLAQRLHSLVRAVLESYPGAWLAWCDPLGHWQPLLKLTPEMLTTHVGFILDYVSEVFHRELRNISTYGTLWQRWFEATPGEWSARDIRSITRTFSGLTKLTFPDGTMTKEDARLLPALPPNSRGGLRRQNLIDGGDRPLHRLLRTLLPFEDVVQGGVEDAVGFGGVPGQDGHLLRGQERGEERLLVARRQRTIPYELVDAGGDARRVEGGLELWQVAAQIHAGRRRRRQFALRPPHVHE